MSRQDNNPAFQRHHIVAANIFADFDGVVVVVGVVSVSVTKKLPRVVAVGFEILADAVLFWV